MNRPCACDRLPPEGQPYSTDFCRLCYLYHTDANYRRLWSDGVEAPTRPPSLARRVVNFTRAIFLHARAGLPVVSEEVARQRLETCHACTEYYDSARDMCKHKTCGCVMRIKVTFGEPENRCPIGKW
jgi:hypothetical protein